MNYTVSNSPYWKVTVKLNNGSLSIVGEMGPSGRDGSGQIYEDLEEKYGSDEFIKRIVPIWKKWHLNDLTPGSPKQEAFLDKLYEKRPDYDVCVSKLKEEDLYEDSSFIYQGKPYKYGSAWLRTEIPQEVIDEIIELSKFATTK